MLLLGQQFDEYRWKNRLILLFTPELQHPNYQQQIAAFTEEEEALQDRKLLVFTLTPKGQLLDQDCVIEKEHHLAIYKKYDITTQDYAVLLLGLDGGLKRKVVNKLVDPKSLFSLIDTMPMRRAEMRRKGKK